MCWREENELYNDGQPFKITCRDMSGVIVTLIADNYFGYSKKEVKSQISYAANLFGGCEEEHSGGALAFPSFNLGEVFRPDSRIRTDGHNFDGLVSLFGDVMHVREEGYGVDKRFPDIIYVPEDATMHLLDQTHPLAAQWPGADHQAAGRAHLHSSLRLQGAHGKTSPCAHLAADRDRCRRHFRAQAVHGFGRRQVGDFEIHRRHHHFRPVLRAAICMTIWRRCRRFSTGIIRSRFRNPRKPATAARC